MYFICIAHGHNITCLAVVRTRCFVYMAAPRKDRSLVKLQHNCFFVLFF